jgi:ribonuclease E
MKKEMLINVLQPEECRIAILEDGVLEELYVERTSHESYVGNIYKGRIVNIEPSIQAAFVDFGVGRNGFLHVSDVEPAYYRHLDNHWGESGRRGSGRDRHRGADRSEETRTTEDLSALPHPDTLPADFETGLPVPATPAELVPQSPAVLADALPDEMDESPSAEAASVPVEDLFALPDVTEASDDLSEDLSSRGEKAVTAPEASLPESPRERRRTSRGNARRRREPLASPVAEESGASPPNLPVAPLAEELAAQPAQETPELPEKPLLMDSAECRTDDEKGVPGEIPPAQEETPDPQDDDLFFPRSQDTIVQTDLPQVSPAQESAPGPPKRDALAAEEREVPEEEEDLEEARHAEEIAEERLSEYELEVFDEGEESSRSREREGRRRDREGGRRGDAHRRGRRSGSGRPGAGRIKPLIQDIFKRGQEVLVQVIKEGIGTKGPTLSTYISIAGRYLVLMPGLNRVGVSRKIQDEEQRRRLREIFNELKPPRGIGFIIRTAGMDKNKKELQNDLAYLSRLWQVVVRRIRKMKAPAEIYQESDMITRTIRDTFTSDIDTIWVDEANAYEHAREFLQIVMPRYANRIKLYEGREPLFHKYRIEDEIARIQQRHVPLAHGGSVVIDQTEALVAIDVNSGTFRADNNAEETAYQMNLQAAKEIARQLRLRDLGGVIVNDFIDMRDEKHRRGVEKALREAVKRDRARTKVLRMSAFGIIEMTRQRIRPSLKRSVYQDCPHCLGTGQVKTCESMSIDVMRLLQLAAHRDQVQRVQVRVAEEVAQYLLNKKRKEITHLEESGSIQVQVISTLGVAPETLEFVCYDNNNNEVKFLNYDDERSRRR